MAISGTWPGPLLLFLLGQISQRAGGETGLSLGREWEGPLAWKQMGWEMLWLLQEIQSTTTIWVQVLRWRHWKLVSPSLWLCSQEGFLLDGWCFILQSFNSLYFLGIQWISCYWDGISTCLKMRAGIEEAPFISYILFLLLLLFCLFDFSWGNGTKDESYKGEWRALSFQTKSLASLKHVGGGCPLLRLLGLMF